MRRWVTQLARFNYYFSISLFLWFLAAPSGRADNASALVLNPGNVGASYSDAGQIKATSLSGTLKWSRTAGDLPPGLSVSTDGKISGTPSAGRSAPYVFTLTATDTSTPPKTEILKYSIQVPDAPVTVLKPGKVGTEYPDAGEIKARGGSGTYTWSKTDGDPLPGLSISMDGTITGTPTDGRSDPYVFTLTVTDTSSKKTKSMAYSILVPDVPLEIVDTSAKTKTVSDDTKEWEARAIVGYHQAGASSAKFTQNFFFDFFIVRDLSKQHLWEEHAWNLWGDVRVASSPQQVSTGVGSFATNFATQVSNIPVNQLAQSADFQTGLEFVLHTHTNDASTKHRALGLIRYVGAMGVFQPPDAQMEIFDVPAQTSLQYAEFAKAFPTAAGAKYVGFVPPNRERFYRSYGLGVRVSTYDDAAPLAPPGIYTISFGQDEAITGGRPLSVVGKIDVFYPIHIPKGSTDGKYDFFFLFGNANLRLSKAVSNPTFALQNPNAGGTTVQPYDPNLAVITVSSARDTYRIGVGVDLLHLIQAFKQQPKPQ